MRDHFVHPSGAIAGLVWVISAVTAVGVCGCTSRCQPGRHLEGGVCVRDSAAGSGAAGASGTGGGGSAAAVSLGGSSGWASSTTSAIGSQGTSGSNAASSSQDQDADVGAQSQNSCMVEGAKRCSGSSAVVVCRAGSWNSDSSCASGEVCTSNGSNQASCVKVLDICRGREGSAVCDGQGILTKCNLDGSAGAVEQCDSPALCQASVSGDGCRKCMVDEHRCVGAGLEVCAPDGTGFTKVRDCDSEALCNALIGDCTVQVCKPLETACQDNTLLTCNEDGSEISSMTPCNEMTCDAQGADCNVCEPGKKTCDGDVAMTCAQSGSELRADSVRVRQEMRWRGRVRRLHRGFALQRANKRMRSRSLPG